MRLSAFRHSPATRRPVFYGWWVVAACCWLQALGAGVFYYGFGTFFLPLTQEFGWTRAVTSSAFSLYRLQDVVLSPTFGFLYDRIGPRRLILFGTSVAGLGFVLFSQVRSYPLYLVSVLVIAGGLSCSVGGTGMATAANWFVRRRTTALGLVMMGAGLGGIIVAAVAGLIEVVGWRETALVAAGVVLACGWPLSRVIRHRPEEMGLRPDGDEPTAEPAAPPGRSASPSTRASQQADGSYGVRQALRTRTFWLLAASTGLSMVAQSAVSAHAIPHLAACGLPATIAASVVSALTLISVAGRVGFGWVGDRLPKRYLLAGLLSFQVAGLIALAGVEEPWQVALFLALYAPSYGGAIPLRPAIQAEYFGRRAFGSIQGVVFACQGVGGAIGPVFAGWMFDELGTYRLALLILAGVNALAIPAALSLPNPRARAAQPAR